MVVDFPCSLLPQIVRIFFMIYSNRILIKHKANICDRIDACNRNSLTINLIVLNDGNFVSVEISIRSRVLKMIGKLYSCLNPAYRGVKFDF